jgi:dsDNA-binding SOS-regulon protein
MTVENRFVVIRHGVEVQIFVDRKAADDYDRMLDIADLVAALLDAAPISLTESQKEEIGIYLAKNREHLLSALQLKKVKSDALPVKKQAISA